MRARSISIVETVAVDLSFGKMTVFGHPEKKS